jgi:putative ABC transport system substrate-binding protein
MRRRACVVLLALAFGAPSSIFAQARMHRVGVVLLGNPHALTVVGLRDGLRELGLEEGRHVVFDVRDVEGDMKSVEPAARSLERGKVDVIVALTSSVAITVKQSTTSVPIVFYAGTDPVANGIVQSFRRPGGRSTGIHGRTAELPAKRLELLKELAPGIRRVATFYRPGNLSAQQSIKSAREAARKLRLDLVERPVASMEALRTSLDALRPGEADAVIFIADAMVNNQTPMVVERANTLGLPTLVPDRESVANGALASYGESFHTIGRIAAKQVRSILTGANPANMPVEQVDKLLFVVNLATAKKLGLAVPAPLLVRADEVIQ